VVEVLEDALRVVDDLVAIHQHGNPRDESSPGSDIPICREKAWPTGSPAY
jgi:hypothetical protein